MLISFEKVILLYGYLKKTALKTRAAQLEKQLYLHKTDDINVLNNTSDAINASRRISRQYNAVNMRKLSKKFVKKYPKFKKVSVIKMTDSLLVFTKNKIIVGIDLYPAKMYVKFIPYRGTYKKRIEIS